MMKRYTTFLESVKEILEDSNMMEDILAYRQQEMEEIFAERKLKWRLKQIILEAEHENRPICIIPGDLEEYLSQFLNEKGEWTDMMDWWKPSIS